MIDPAIDRVVDRVVDRVHFLIATSAGALGHYGHLMRHMAAAGHEVHLWTMEPIDPARAAARIPHVHCHRLPLGRSETSPLGALRTIARGVRLAAGGQASLFTTWSVQTNLLCGLPLRAWNRRCIFLVPGLGTIFSSDRRGFRLASRAITPLYRWMFRGPASRVIVLNRDDLAFMTDVIGVPRDRIFVMHGGCGVDPAEFPFVEQLPAQRIVLVPARLIREKGIFEAARASRILLDRGVDHEMWFSSDVDLGNPLTLSRAEVAALPQLSPAIRILGYQRTMPPVFQAAYAVCLPTYREGVPTALVEASATGRPIVTTDAVGARDLIRHEHNGLRVPIGDALALADALERVLTDGALADRLRRNAYAHYLAHCTQQRTLLQALPAYRSLGLTTPAPAATSCG
jgi:glycosyltransferase involved in cell wall biosynthesis